MTRRAVAVAEAAVLTTTVVAILTAASAQAATPSAVAPILRLTQAYPHGYIEATVAPGQSMSTTIVVADGATAPATFLISAVDGYTSTSGGVVYGNRAVPFRDGPTGNGEYGAGHWLTVGADHVALAPGQSSTVTLSATVPATAAPGDWVGGVTVENPQGSATGSSGGPQLRITEASEMAVVIHVPGPASKGAIFLGRPTVSTEGVQQFLNIPLRYTGDLLTKPTFAFTIRDSAGTTVYSHSGQFDTFVPHTTIVYQVRLDPVLAPGAYSFSGSAGVDGQDNTATFALPVTGSPVALPSPRSTQGSDGTGGGGQSRPLTFVAPVLALVAAALLAVVLRRRRNRCSHCDTGRVGALMTVADFQELAHCGGCRRRALQREEVRLCPTCYRAHVLPAGFSASAV